MADRFVTPAESVEEWAERVTHEVFGERRCMICRFSAPAPSGHSWLLMCRYNPPQIGPRGAEWPQVTVEEWCGQWEARRE